jgi:transcriptional regulator with XRE-family HTH domain
MTKRSRTTSALPGPARAALVQLGRDVQTARKRRRIPLRQMAERMMVSVTTLVRLEKGDPGVGLGILASALWALGLHARLGELAEPDRDLVGKQQERARLPKRIRSSAPSDFDF